MLNIHSDGMYLRGGALIPAADGPAAGLPSPAEAKKGTIAYRILQSHNTSGNSDALEITFDAMASHDITYVGIIQTARASGMRAFPLPYVRICRDRISRICALLSCPFRAQISSLFCRSNQASKPCIIP